MRKSDANRIDFLAFGMPDAEAVDTIAASLADSGVKFASEPGTLSTPGGGYGFRFFDPDGSVVELSADVKARGFRVLEPREDIRNSATLSSTLRTRRR